jgi:hypothetical protein
LIVFPYLIGVFVRVPVVAVDGSLSKGIENLNKDTSFGNICLPSALELDSNWAIRFDIVGDKLIDLLLSHQKGVSQVSTVAELSLRYCHILVKWYRSGRGWRIVGLALIIEEGKVNLGERRSSRRLAWHSLVQFSYCHPHASWDAGARIESGFVNKLSGGALSEGNSVFGDISTQSLAVVGAQLLVPSVQIIVDWGIIED